jgi:hypothetical protein
LPLDIVVLLDKSGSMAGNNWYYATTALQDFVDDAESAGMGVGLEYFPVDAVNDCNESDYANLDVPIATLPGNAAALISSLNSTSPSGATPTYGALSGALQAATLHQAATPTRKTIVLFVTDGDPTTCAITDVPTIAALAQSALDSSGVRTYVVGAPGGTVANLDMIAAAGGTQKAYDATGDITTFTAVLTQIRAAAACDLAVPSPPAEPSKVNVLHSDGSQPPTVIPHANGMQDCGDGWFFDAATPMTRITLCPSTCAATKGSSFTLRVGCDTVEN